MDLLTIELGADVEDIAPMLSERKAQLKNVDRQLAAPADPPDRALLKAALERKIDN